MIKIFPTKTKKRQKEDLVVKTWILSSDTIETIRSTYRRKKGVPLHVQYRLKRPDFPLSESIYSLLFFKFLEPLLLFHVFTYVPTPLQYEDVNS